MLRGDTVKDDSGSYAVLTEQGSSASQMTAAEVMDVIARLPGCGGQAADAVSVYTQATTKDAPKSLKLPKSECPDTRIRLRRHKCGRTSKTLWFFLNEICMVNHLPNYCVKDNLKSSIGTLMGKSTEFGMPIRVSKTRSLLYLYMWMTQKKGSLVWKKLMKLVDLGEPTSYLDHEY